jgi:hypothetical protein
MDQSDGPLAFFAGFYASFAKPNVVEISPIQRRFEEKQSKLHAFVARNFGTAGEPYLTDSGRLCQRYYRRRSSGANSAMMDFATRTPSRAALTIPPA